MLEHSDITPLIEERVAAANPMLLPQPELPFSLSPWVDEAFGRMSLRVEEFFQHFKPLIIDPHLNERSAYGVHSVQAAGETLLQPYNELLTDHPLFQGVILLLALAYLLMLCANGSELLSLLSSKRREAGRNATGGAVHTSAIIGLVMAAALAVRYAEGTAAESIGTMTLLPMALGLMLGLFLAQALLLTAVGHLTLSQELSKGIIYLKVVCSSLASLIIVPFALLLVLCPINEGRLWFYIILAGCGLLLLIYLKETFQLFLLKKISILHWILYLCAVELLPISFIALKLIRW